jgi:hypothetical protein
MLALVGGAVAAFAPAAELAELTTIAPSLASLIERATTEPDLVARELRAFGDESNTIAPTFAMPTPGPNNASLPIVVARENLVLERASSASELAHLSWPF